MTIESNRRPLAVREWAIIRKAASRLAKCDITPNQISVTSAFFAALAGISTCAMGHVDIPTMWVLAVVSALAVLGRALCNVFDGMVAVEGGKSTKSGELFNDIPDRVSDSFIFIGSGYAVGDYMYGSDLGWAAALLSVMTAYIRYVGRAAGAPSNFSGPMAKVHRMAVIVAALLLTPVAAGFGCYPWPLLLGLTIICVGSLVTCARRANAAYLYIESK